MPVTLTTPPLTIRAGETLAFVASAYSAEDYSLQFVLNNGVDEPTVVAGEADETRFNVSVLAPLVPGKYAWAEIYTDEDGVVVYGPQGFVDVLPSLLTKVSPTHAATMVTKLRKVMEAFASSNKQSFSTDGESFTRDNLESYQNLLNFYEAKLKAETGAPVGGFIHVNFIPAAPRLPNCCP
jgi:hypothetical protein